jgi:hypothetical protein
MGPWERTPGFVVNNVTREGFHLKKAQTLPVARPGLHRTQFAIEG